MSENSRGSKCWEMIIGGGDRLETEVANWNWKGNCVIPARDHGRERLKRGTGKSKSRVSRVSIDARVSRD